MPPLKADLADVLGVPPESIEAVIKIRIPEGPSKAQREHAREMITLRILGWFSGGALVLTFLLCWLFLYYNRPEQAEKVVATVIGFIGGIGIGQYRRSGKGEGDG
jgi:hypothetical protein